MIPDKDLFGRRQSTYRLEKSGKINSTGGLAVTTGVEMIESRLSGDGVTNTDDNHYLTSQPRGTSQNTTGELRHGDVTPVSGSDVNFPTNGDGKLDRVTSISTDVSEMNIYNSDMDEGIIASNDANRKQTNTIPEGHTYI